MQTNLPPPPLHPPNVVNLTGCHKPLFHEADIYDNNNDNDNKKDNDDDNGHNDDSYLSFLRFARATRPLDGNLHRGSYFVILCESISHLSSFEHRGSYFVSEYFSFVKF